ncbi:oxidoreductase [Apiospora phragmitis]|uniref:Oxidoreductase n=1 Tax=Apiospora phragmitis TaxID=2905665 RepID=A0ABR1WSB9_9PEZI
MGTHRGSLLHCRVIALENDAIDCLVDRFLQEIERHNMKKGWVIADLFREALKQNAEFDNFAAKAGQLRKSSLSVAGGRARRLDSGGGISFFGPREGWTCDQVTQFEVVLANGSVVGANEKENADLWWGLRGGSNNFGIMTSLTFRTFEQGLLWTSMTFNPLTEVKNQVRIYARIMAAENYDVNASFLTGWAYVGQMGTTVILNQLAYTRPVGNEVPPLYQPILDLPSASPSLATPPVVANMSTIAQNSTSFPPQPRQAARYMTVPTCFVLTESMLRAAHEAFTASLPLVKDVPGIMWGVNIEPIPPSMWSNKNNGDGRTNALGLAGRFPARRWACFLSPVWADADHDDAARSLIADVERRAKGQGLYDPYIYLDYAAPWQEVPESYGEEDVGKLQELRKRVDPDMVFTHQVKGGFKIQSSE